MIRVAMGDVNFKIVPEASAFRGDAYFDGPGAHKYRFGRNAFFLENIFKPSHQVLLNLCALEIIRGCSSSFWGDFGFITEHFW